jgi:hypothetical protein
MGNYFFSENVDSNIKKIIQERKSDDEEIIYFNVGGKFFQILKSSLKRNENYLIKLIQKENPLKDKEGNYFIDRSPVIIF